MPIKFKYTQEDKSNYLYYSICSRLRVPYLIQAIDGLPLGSTCLDIGCGIGFFSNIMCELGLNVIGIDPDPQAIAKAKNKYSKSENIKFIEATAERIPLGDNSIDFVICSEVFEHVEDLKKTLNEIKRVCKRGAKFFFSVPSRDGIFKTFFLKIGHSESNRFEKDCREPFTMSEISKFIVSENLTVKRSFYSKVFFSEIIMGLTKQAHEFLNKGKSLSGQADIGNPPLIYKKIFPFLLFMGKIDDLLLRNFIKGHMIILEGNVNK